MEVSSFVKSTWKLLPLKIEKCNTLRVRSTGSPFCQNDPNTKGNNMEKLTRLAKETICTFDTLLFSIHSSPLLIRCIKYPFYIYIELCIQSSTRCRIERTAVYMQGIVFPLPRLILVPTPSILVLPAMLMHVQLPFPDS